MRSLKIGFAVMAAVLASITAASAQQVLKVAINDGRSLLGGYDSAIKAFDGMSVEFINAIAADAKLKIELVAMPAGEHLAALTGKKVDIVASELRPAPDGALEKAAEVSYTYASYRDVLVVKNSNRTNYKSKDDLKGLNIALLKGSDFAADATKLGAKTKLYDTAREALVAVETGAAEGALLYGHIAKEAMRTNGHPELKVADSYTTPIRKLDMVFVVQKGNALLLQTVNDTMQKLLFNQSGSKITFKWGVEAAQSYLSEPCVCAGP